MNKLKTVVQYECSTSFKYIWIFYGIELLVVALISAVVFVSTGSMDHVGSNALEVNTLIYFCVLGVLGYKEDFKMLIQNGFTRKYIYLGTIAMFSFISAVMALVDTLFGRGMHQLSANYFSMFGALYGYDQMILFNFLWLFLLYMCFGSLLYLVVLVIHKVERIVAVCGGITLGLVVILVLPVVFRFVLPQAFTEAFIKAILKGAGFMADGTVNLLYPLAALAILAVLFNLVSYRVIQRTELVTV